MFALSAEYLMGWAMASADGARKQQPEWPPHPDRMFMALAAAWFETGQDTAEGDALRWLETQAPPALCASPAEERAVVTHYVPVNDASLSSAKVVQGVVEDSVMSLDRAKAAGLALLPEYRSRQPRSFPVALPHRPVVHWCWAVQLPPWHADALASLCAKVTCIGHSASVVRMGLDHAPPQPNWVPGEGPQALRLRTTGAGRLDGLERRMNRNAVLAYAAMEQAVQQAKGRARQVMQKQLQERFAVPPVSLRPEAGRWQGYVRQAPIRPPAEVVGGVFDDRLLVLSLQGARIGVLSTLQLTSALRGAMLAGCTNPLPAWLSGHEADGSPSRLPHIALFPLPFTDGTHADGRLLGAAIALPHAVSPSAVAKVLDPWLRDPDTGLPRVLRIFDDRGLRCTAALDLREDLPQTLCVETWTRPSRRWASVTPIVLDRHGRDENAAVETVAQACMHMGLPRPDRVQLHRNAAVPGAPPSSRFAAMERKRGGGRLAHTHAVIDFGVEVQGPVLLGAGRFRGYGLCKPLVWTAADGESDE